MNCHLVVQNPVDLEMIFPMKTCMEKDELHRFIRCVVGNGGIYAPGKMFHYLLFVSNIKYLAVAAQTALCIIF